MAKKKNLNFNKIIKNKNTARLGLGALVLASFFILAQPSIRGYVSSNSFVAQVVGSISGSANAVVLPQEQLPVAPTGKVWQIAFYDEFDGSNVNAEKWNIIGDYFRGANPGVYVNKSDTYLDGSGHLVLRVRYDSTLGKYTGGSLDTMGKFSNTFGYFNARIMNHKDQGQSEAFWIMSGSQTNVDNSAQDGAEIDIYEKPDVGDILAHGVIWDGYQSSLKKDSTFVTVPGVGTGYHDFGLLWQSDIYRFFVDSKQTFSSVGGGVAQQPGYIIFGHGPTNWKGDITKATLPDYMYIDYVHAYELNPKVGYTYKVHRTTINNTYPDAGNELNNGVIASTADFKNSEWMAVVGQPTYYFEIELTLPSPASQIVMHTLRNAGAGIYLPPKIQLYCGSNMTKEWLVSKPSEDGLYQIILNDVPTSCGNNAKLRVWNGWWTFLSEITVRTKSDIIPPKLQITSPANNSTTNPSSYAQVSGTNAQINVNATDNVGISSVQFKIGTTVLGTDTTAPYGVTFDSTKIPNGIATITATAYDAVGNSTSYFVTVNIANQTVPVVLNDASCDSVSVPSTVAPGAQLNASVVFVNTGSAKWIDNNQGVNNYYAATTPDGQNWFTPYNTSDQFAHHWSQLQTASVSSGSKATFKYSGITAPTTPGVYDLKFQMLQQNVGWFGSVCSATITVK